MTLRLLAHQRDAVVLEHQLGDANVVLFDPRLERSFESLLNRLRMADLSLASLDLLVLRASHRDAQHELEQDAVLADYLQEVPVLMLTGSHNAAAPAPTLARPSWAERSKLEPDVFSFRASEFEALLRRSSAIFHHHGCHYNLPSSAVHAEKFIRLADALQDSTDLVRAADWVLPLLGERSGLAADTGSLLGLMAVVRNEALLRFGWGIPLASLDRYPPDEGSVEALIDNFMVTGWQDLVFLISVNSTGAVARYVRRRLPMASIVALCETAMTEDQRADAAGGEARNFVEHPVERWRLDEQRRCERCQALDLLHVHPETYEITPPSHGHPCRSTTIASRRSGLSGRLPTARMPLPCTSTRPRLSARASRSVTFRSASTSRGCSQTRGSSLSPSHS